MAWSCPVNVRLLFVLWQSISLGRVKTRSQIYFCIATGERCRITGKILRDSKVSLVVCNYVTSPLKAIVLGMKPSASGYCHRLQDMRNILGFSFVLYTAFSKIPARVPSGGSPGDFNVSVPWGQTSVLPLPCNLHPTKKKKAAGPGLLCLFNWSHDASVHFLSLGDNIMVRSYS